MEQKPLAYYEGVFLHDTLQWEDEFIPFDLAIELGQKQNNSFDISNRSKTLDNDDSQHYKGN